MFGFFEHFNTSPSNSLFPPRSVKCILGFSHGFLMPRIEFGGIKSALLSPTFNRIKKNPTSVNHYQGSACGHDDVNASKSFDQAKREQQHSKHKHRRPFLDVRNNLFPKTHMSPPETCVDRSSRGPLTPGWAAFNSPYTTSTETQCQDSGAPTSMSKTCTCGKHFESIPKNARFHSSDDEFEGWYWDCSCGSTLFVPA